MASARSPDVCLQVRSDPRLLAVVRSLVREWLGTLGLGDERIGELVLAVDEACTNAIRHAYRGRCDDRIDLVLATDAEGILIEVCDRGVTAEPERVEPKSAEILEAGALQPGGLGIPLMHRCFDEVEFEPQAPCGNRVRLRLRRDDGAARGEGETTS